MVNYDVDTEPRLRIYVGLVLASSFLAPAIAKVLGNISRQSKDGLEEAVPTFLISPFIDLAVAVSPFVTSFVIFGGLLFVFDRYLWRWPLIHGVSGIPDLEGTWEGRLRRTSSADIQEEKPKEHKAKCYITQTRRRIDFVFIDFLSTADFSVIDPLACRLH